MIVKFQKFKPFSKNLIISSLNYYKNQISIDEYLSQKIVLWELKSIRFVSVELKKK